MKYDYVDIKKSKSIYWDWMHLLSTRSNVYFKIEELKKDISRDETFIREKREDPKKYSYINLIRIRTQNKLNIEMLKHYKKWAKELDRNINEFMHSEEYKQYEKDIYNQPKYKN